MEDFFEINESEVSDLFDEMDIENSEVEAPKKKKRKKRDKSENQKEENFKRKEIKNKTIFISFAKKILIKDIKNKKTIVSLIAIIPFITVFVFYYFNNFYNDFLDIILLEREFTIGVSLIVFGVLFSLLFALWNKNIENIEFDIYDYWFKQKKREEQVKEVINDIVSNSGEINASDEISLEQYFEEDIENFRFQISIFNAPNTSPTELICYQQAFSHTKRERVVVWRVDSFYNINPTGNLLVVCVNGNRIKDIANPKTVENVIRIYENDNEQTKAKLISYFFISTLLQHSLRTITKGIYLNVVNFELVSKVGTDISIKIDFQEITVDDKYIRERLRNNGIRAYSDIREDTNNAGWISLKRSSNEDWVFWFSSNSASKTHLYSENKSPFEIEEEASKSHLEDFPLVGGGSYVEKTSPIRREMIEITWHQIWESSGLPNPHLIKLQSQTFERTSGGYIVSANFEILSDISNVEIIKALQSAGDLFENSKEVIIEHFPSSGDAIRRLTWSSKGLNKLFYLEDGHKDIPARNYSLRYSLLKLISNLEIIKINYLKEDFIEIVCAPNSKASLEIVTKAEKELTTDLRVKWLKAGIPFDTEYRNKDKQYFSIAISTKETPKPQFKTEFDRWVVSLIIKSALFSVQPSFAFINLIDIVEVEKHNRILETIWEIGGGVSWQEVAKMMTKILEKMDGQGFKYARITRRIRGGKPSSNISIFVGSEEINRDGVAQIGNNWNAPNGEQILLGADWELTFLQLGVGGSGTPPLLYEIKKEEQINVYHFDISKCTKPEFPPLGELKNTMKLNYLTLNSSKEETGIYSLECALADPFPSKIDFPTQDFIGLKLDDKCGDEAWNLLLIGANARKKSVAWDVKEVPHCLLAGDTGSGKTITAFGIMASALQKNWRLFIADPKISATYSQINKAGIADMVSSGEEECDELLDTVFKLMETRKNIVNNKGVDKWFAGDQKYEKGKTYRPALIVIEEGLSLLETLDNDQKSKLVKIAAQGRSVGIHLLIVTQSVKSSVLDTKIRTNFGARINIGPVDDSKASTLFETKLKNIPPISTKTKGRGVMKGEGSDFQVFQSYYDASFETGGGDNYFSRIVKNRLDSNVGLPNIDPNEPIG